MQDHSGFFGALGLLGAGALYFVLRRFFPSLSTALLVLGGILLVLLLLLVAVVFFFAMRSSKKKAVDWRQEEVQQVRTRGRSSLMELRRLSMRIKDQQIRQLSEGVCSGIDRILRTLKDHPENVTEVRRFFNGALPMAAGILTKYTQLEASGLPARDSTRRTADCLRDLSSAMDKQYANLFDNEVLDLTVEMETLKMICKRDGLLEDIPAPEEEEEQQGITLTL